MINEFKKGIIRGVATLLVVGGGLFAFQVSGTIKTWTTGETLTAADLNTTVQSLKTGIENASQQIQLLLPTSPLSYPYYFPVLTSIPSPNNSEMSVPMLRAGNVSSTRLDIRSNSASACTITLRKNAVATAIVLTVPAGSTTSITDGDVVNYTAGDVLTWSSDCTSSLSGFLSFEIK